MEKRRWTPKYESQNMTNLLATGMDFVVFDLETDGVNPQKNHIIQISAIKFRKKGGGYAFSSKLNMYINQRMVHFPTEEELKKEMAANPKKLTAFMVNKITKEKVDGCPDENEAFGVIRNFFGDTNKTVYVGYNHRNFDIKFMDKLYMRQAGEPFEAVHTIDVKALAEELIYRDELIGLEDSDPENGHYTQTSVAKLLKVDTEGAHDAMADIVMTSKLMGKLYADYCENYALKDAEVKNNPKAKVTHVHPFKKGKESNFLIIGLRNKVNGIYQDARIHYDIFNKCFVEDEGKMLLECDMYDVIRQCEAQGGSLSKFKLKSA